MGTTVRGSRGPRARKSAGFLVARRSQYMGCMTDLAVASSVPAGRVLPVTIRKYHRSSSRAKFRFERVMRGLMHSAPSAGGRLVLFRTATDLDATQASTWALFSTEVQRVVGDPFERRLIVETANSRYLVTLDDASREEFVQFCSECLPPSTADRVSEELAT